MAKNEMAPRVFNEDGKGLHNHFAYVNNSVERCDPPRQPHIGSFRIAGVKQDISYASCCFHHDLFYMYPGSWFFTRYVLYSRHLQIILFSALGPVTAAYHMRSPIRLLASLGDQLGVSVYGIFSP